MIYSQIAAAANVVPNPSFETYTVCPAALGDLYRAVPWQAPTLGSPDYYNACAPNVSGVGLVNNNFGTQPARTGNGYAGAICRPAFPYREYVEVALSAPLAAAQPVQVEFWVSLSDESRDAIDRIGAYFSVGSVGPVSNTSELPYTPQIESPAGVFRRNSSVASSRTATSHTWWTRRPAVTRRRSTSTTTPER